MKKICFLSFALLLFSCSQEDQTTVETQSKNTQTIDTNIGYESPFEGFYTYLETIKYSFLNDASVDLRMVATPYFGLAYCDGDTSDLVHFGVDLMFNRYGPSYPGGNAPNLTGFGQVEHGGFVEGQSIMIVPNSSGFSYVDYDRVSQQFIIPNNGMEYSLIHKQGKLFFYKIQILDSNGTIVTDGIVKSYFPEDIHPDRTFPYPWKALNQDFQLGDMLVYNELTGEVCMTTLTGTSQHSYKMTFDYQNIKYEVGTEMSQDGLKLYLVKR